MDKSQNYYDVRQKFDLVANGPALFGAIVTGLEVKLFKFIFENPGYNRESISEKIGMSAEKMRVLLQSLCSIGLLEKREGKYYSSEFASEQLVIEGEDSWLDILKGWQHIYYPSFIHLTQALKSGSNKLALSEFEGEGESLYKRLESTPIRQKLFHKAMSGFTLKSMSGLLEHPHISSVNNLLDIGGNDGTTANKLVEAFPEMKITIFDLPTVAGENITDQYVERISLCSGDLFEDEFPIGFDGILFSHLLEIFSEEQIIFLLKKAYQSIERGGKVFIYGYNVSDNEVEGLYSARLSLYLNVLASGSGMAYPKSDWEKWMRMAGFVNVETTTGLPFEHGLTFGQKTR